MVCGMEGKIYALIIIVATRTRRKIPGVVRVLV